MIFHSISISNTHFTDLKITLEQYRANTKTETNTKNSHSSDNFNQNIFINLI